MRRNLHDEETLDNEHKYFQLFLGECSGIGLYPRGDRKPGKPDHVCFDILHEDDTHWFTSPHGFSSFWLPDLQEALQAALTWLNLHCDPDPSGYGWTFRS